MPLLDLSSLRGDPPAQRRLIDDLLRAALSAVDPREAIFRRVRRIGHTLTLADRAIDLRRADRVFLVSIGKAAMPMAEALIDLLGDGLTAGVVVTKRGHAAGWSLPDRVQVIEAGHPVPDEDSIAGARAIESLLRDATERDVLLCAISGGGSALVTLPVEGIALIDLQTTTDALLRSGATIHELNAVRKRLDRIKGGGLARLARGADVVSLILSDVIGDDPGVIASGPTAPDHSTLADARRAIERYDLAGQLPASVRAHLQTGRSAEPVSSDADFDRVLNLIVGSNCVAVEAAEKAARASGFNTLRLTTFLQGEAREAGTIIAAIAREIDASGQPAARPACVIAGGETTVTVRGAGKGGRDQELALSAAIGIDGLRDTWIAALATDGGDGPTDAAGAVVNGETIGRAREAGCDPMKSLAGNDSYGFFTDLRGFGNPSGLITTGPTGTNVNDLIWLLLF